MLPLCCLLYESVVFCSLFFKSLFEVAGVLRLLGMVAAAGDDVVSADGAVSIMGVFGSNQDHVMN